jgi:proteasome lid subunit RPN8/RPN11
MPMVEEGLPQDEAFPKMESSRVRLGPPETPDPRPARIPRSRVRRWNSPYDREAGKPAVSVFLTQAAFVRVCSLAGRDMDNEVGGALIGQWRIDPPSGEQFIVAEAVLLARHTRQGSAFLTFTQDTLVALHDEQEERYPEKRMVGWFHTHPRMGVFLSDYDLWLHKHFFPEPWQVALVIEPHTQIGGFFVRDADGNLDPHRYHGFLEIVGDSGKSLVYWKNLEPSPFEGRTEGEGEADHE